MNHEHSFLDACTYDAYVPLLYITPLHQQLNVREIKSEIKLVDDHGSPGPLRRGGAYDYQSITNTTTQTGANNGPFLMHIYRYGYVACAILVLIVDCICVFNTIRISISNIYMTITMTVCFMYTQR